jgi:hypothetical protein
LEAAGFLKTEAGWSHELFTRKAFHDPKPAANPKIAEMNGRAPLPEAIGLALHLRANAAAQHAQPHLPPPGVWWNDFKRFARLCERGVFNERKGKEMMYALLDAFSPGKYKSGSLTKEDTYIVALADVYAAFKDSPPAVDVSMKGHLARGVVCLLGGPYYPPKTPLAQLYAAINALLPANGAEGANEANEAEAEADGTALGAEVLDGAAGADGAEVLDGTGGANGANGANGAVQMVEEETQTPDKRKGKKRKCKLQWTGEGNMPTIKVARSRFYGAKRSAWRTAQSAARPAPPRVAPIHRETAVSAETAVTQPVVAKKKRTTIAREWIGTAELPNARAPDCRLELGPELQLEVEEMTIGRNANARSNWLMKAMAQNKKLVAVMEETVGFDDGSFRTARYALGPLRLWPNTRKPVAKTIFHALSKAGHRTKPDEYGALERQPTTARRDAAKAAFAGHSEYDYGLFFDVESDPDARENESDGEYEDDGQYEGED